MKRNRRKGGRPRQTSSDDKINMEGYDHYEKLHDELQSMQNNFSMNKHKISKLQASHQNITKKSFTFTRNPKAHCLRNHTIHAYGFHVLAFNTPGY